MAFYAIAPVIFITTFLAYEIFQARPQRRMACNGLSSRERDVKPKGHLTPNDTLGEEGRVTEMVMEEECSSVCVADLPPFFCIHRVKVFPLLDCIVHESLLSSPLGPGSRNGAGLGQRTNPFTVLVPIHGDACPVLRTRWSFWGDLILRIAT